MEAEGAAVRTWRADTALWLGSREFIPRENASEFYVVTSTHLEKWEICFLKMWDLPFKKELVSKLFKNLWIQQNSFGSTGQPFMTSRCR